MAEERGEKKEYNNKRIGGQKIRKRNSRSV